ncbi:MAG: phosphoenolpyruvate carboxykinase (GTP) [Clostridiaceae bacterium]|nr:phosphoenolpyruvate carboxykinase (GTP) [Clostridiaceae bacterium]
MTENRHVIEFVRQSEKLMCPDKVVWIDGSREQIEEIRALGCKTGEMVKLNEEKLPGCYYHRSAINDVARVESRTFICTPTKAEAGNTNNWMAPEDAYKMSYDIMRGSMNGRVMYVIPYIMGAAASPFAKVGIEITDSIYVVLSMNIMTRVGKIALEVLGESGDFVKGLHSKVNLDENNRYILQFPQDNTIISCNSGYGGNVLLGKKCFALRIASYQGRKEGWMAEHMMILGVEFPNGEVKYVAGAFPSACGKTNLAMLIPPEYYEKKGYKVWTIGDDIAWIRIGSDGRFYAVNPEAGFFGVAPGTSNKSNPNALASTMRDTIFTNVVYKPEDGTVWWEGLDKNPPDSANDWKGNAWDPANGSKGAHPNSRFTSPARNCPCISSKWEDPKGVPLSAIIFGGRRAKTAPLVYQARDWNHGVFVGSAMASETTAAATGAVGVVRRDPMAMLPFCGYDMGEYFEHWIEMGKKASNPPKIFNVNWFRLNDNGKFVWPGFGENLRVLEWILRRCDESVDAEETEIGYLPKADDICLEGLDYNIDDAEKFDINSLRSILKVEKKLWLDDAENLEAFYNKIGDTVPQELRDCLENLKERLGACCICL